MASIPLRLLPAWEAGQLSLVAARHLEHLSLAVGPLQQSASAGALSFFTAQRLLVCESVRLVASLPQ